MDLRQHALTITLCVLLVAIASSCSAKPTEPVLIDSAFSRQALLDPNGNGRIDSEDTPIENATFSVELDDVKVFSETTDETGFAFILIPSGVKYPVNVSMEAPKDSTLKLVIPSAVTVSASTGTAQFLFSLK